MEFLISGLLYNLLVAMCVSPLFIWSGIANLRTWHIRKKEYQLSAPTPPYMPFGPPTADKHTEIQAYYFTWPIRKVIFEEQGALYFKMGILKILFALMLIANFGGPLLTSVIRGK